MRCRSRESSSGMYKFFKSDREEVEDDPKRRDLGLPVRPRNLAWKILFTQTLCREDQGHCDEVAKGPQGGLC
ncbi:hypothetical protein Pmani_014446 [Petrolisthes manimaculis]|uniref:Uncharacterized protein n=1 Tax=Petrolisthes manimaculis TaxID=1843537 RepID=A0AAE1PSY4_9EUCA|nr:hypothetical protein Pmani_014446 [Petrolisthes manimaculis]